MGSRNISNKISKFFPSKEGSKKQAEGELHCRVHSSAFPNYFRIQTLLRVPYVTLNLGIFALSARDKARESYLMCRIKVFNWHDIQIRKCIFFSYIAIAENTGQRRKQWQITLLVQNIFSFSNNIRDDPLKLLTVFRKGWGEGVSTYYLVSALNPNPRGKPVMLTFLLIQSGQRLQCSSGLTRN